MPRPFLRPTARTALYGALLLVPGCFGECDQAAKSLGPPVEGVTVDRLVTSVPTGNVGFQLLDLYFTDIGSFTVTAQDAQGRPVPNSQNGIVVDVDEEEDVLSIEVVDEPDADNATIRVLVHPRVVSAPTFMGPGNVITLRFQNPDNTSAAGSVVVGIRHDIARLELNPEGPLTVAIGQTVPVTLRALDAQGNPVPGAEPFIDVRSTNTLSDTDFDLELDWNGPADGVVSGSVTGLHEDTGSATFSLAGNSTVEATLNVTVVSTIAPSGHVVSVASTDAIHVNLTTDLEAVLYDSQGNPVPGDAFVTATSSNPAVATVEAKIDTVPNDGRVAFRVKGVSVGQTTITYRYPGGPNGADTTDTTILTVNP